MRQLRYPILAQLASGREIGFCLFILHPPLVQPCAQCFGMAGIGKVQR